MPEKIKITCAFYISEAVHRIQNIRYRSLAKQLNSVLVFFVYVSEKLSCDCIAEVTKGHTN